MQGFSRIQPRPPPEGGGTAQTYPLGYGPASLFFSFLAMRETLPEGEGYLIAEKKRGPASLPPLWGGKAIFPDSWVQACRAYR
jgi:hypothetical protein